MADDRFKVVNDHANSRHWFLIASDPFANRLYDDDPDITGDDLAEFLSPIMSRWDFVTYNPHTFGLTFQKDVDTVHFKLRFG